MIHVICDSVTFELNGDIALNQIKTVGTPTGVSAAPEKKMPKRIVLVAVQRSVLTRIYDPETKSFCYQLEAAGHFVEFKSINQDDHCF